MKTSFSKLNKSSRPIWIYAACLCVASLLGVLFSVKFQKPISVEENPQTKKVLPAQNVLLTVEMIGLEKSSVIVTLLNIVDLNSEMNAFERELSLEKVVPELGQAEMKILFDFFAASSSGVADWSPAEIYGLKNNLMNVLLEESELKDMDFIGHLTALAENMEVDLVMRNYALQHLAAYQNRSPESDEVNYKVHLEALSSQEPSIAATAMLHLLFFEKAGRLNTADREVFAAAAWRMAEDPAVPAGHRATALQVSSHLNLQGVYQLAFALASNHRQTPFLRIAAIASLDGPDLPISQRKFLENLVEGPEDLFRKPAQAALARANQTL